MIIFDKHYDRTEYREFEKAKHVDEDEEEEPPVNSTEIDSFSPINFGVCNHLL